MGTAISTTPTPMTSEFPIPSSRRVSWASLPNQPKVRHSHGLTRGKLAELKAVIAMIASGPNR